MPKICLIWESRTLLLGIFLGFALSIVSGHFLSNERLIENFRRFNVFTDSETQFFPTIRQLRSLATAKLNSKHPVLVIIGGSSVLHGTGQPYDDIWSDHLQKVLGPKFAVINLAMNGTPPSAGAECLAEYFIKKNTSVIYIGDIGCFGLPIDGGETNRYQYWQAYSASFLLPNQEREKQAREADKDTHQEFRAELGEYLRFDDLWTSLTYKYFSTIWIPPFYGIPWWSSHSVEEANELADPGDIPPVPDRFYQYTDSRNAIELEIIRGISTHEDYSLSNGQWKSSEYTWQQHTKEFLTAFAAPVRERTIIIRQQSAPYYINQLSAAEREREKLCSDETLDRLRSINITPVALYHATDEDYIDRVHLTACGGHKLANLVAQNVLQISHRLYGVETGIAGIKSEK